MKFPALFRPQKVDARLILAALMLALMLAPGAAFASDSTDTLGLNDLLEWLLDLVRGPAGKIIAILAFLVGLIAGVAKGSFMSFLTGLGFAVVIYYGPGVILSVFGAAL